MLRQMLTYLPAMILARLAGFAVLIGAAHLLDHEATGLLALAMLTADASESIFLTWLRIFLLRIGAAEGKIAPGTARLCLRFWVMGLLAAGGLSGGVSALLASQDFGRFFGTVMGLVIALSLFKFGLALLQMAGRAKTHALLEGGRGVAVAIAALWVMVGGSDWHWAVLALSGVTALFGGLALWRGRTGIGGSGHERDMPVLLEMAPPLIGLAALNVIIGSTDRLALGLFSSPASLAPYATSYALGRQGFDVMTNALNAGGFPALVAVRARGREQGRLGQQARLLIALMLACYAGLVLARHDLAALLLQEAYRAEAIALLPIIGLGAVALNLKNGLTDNVLLVEGHFWRQMTGLAVGAGVAVVAALALVPLAGSLGAALAFAFGAMSVLSISFWQARKLLLIEIDKAGFVGVLSPALMVILVCLGATYLLAASDPALRLAVMLGLSAPLVLWALNRGKTRVVADGG